ncbi:aspartyl-phosphate phosphatase Spo0E family protein [Paenibacillus beijingensis]|uniref:Uncharacterized protein n=1 Tax=Paenibacillus beijingensis TaxID=1126833 RepID=A0A0D5NFH3_9BACL|nr:aspartyl-phosphate phosphatase Spo0E family protein [Paenibacillus beijingensis]AJY73722.1 hypothetical protein VN24_02605 [Paenibacillus beijingensis]
MTELEMIRFNIELYRALLNDLAGSSPETLTSGKVLHLSQELDELIIKYYQVREKVNEAERSA